MTSRPTTMVEEEGTEIIGSEVYQLSETQSSERARKSSEKASMHCDRFWYHSGCSEHELVPSVGGGRGE